MDKVVFSDTSAARRSSGTSGGIRCALEASKSLRPSWGYRFAEWARSRAASQNGVELALQCQTSAGTSQFLIALRNTGSTYTQLVLGTNVGNGQRFDPNHFFLDVKRDGNDAVEVFHPEEDPIVGPAGPWLVPLPAMSEFSFLVPISRLWSSTPRFEQLKIGGSAIDVRLRYVAPARWPGSENASANRKNVFAGRLATEWLRAPDKCHAA